MYCPACDKEFSPVHSRCPECKGWLRVSGPTVGAAKATTGPVIRSATPAGNIDTATTQKVQPITGANVPLPSRPKPAAAAAASARGLGGDWGPAEAPAAPPPRPAPSLQTSTEPVDQAGRGALGTGWESSSSFSAPAAPTPASGGWGSAAPAGPASSWGAPSAGAASWPAAEPPKPSGWGAPAATPPNNTLGGLGGGGLSNGLGSSGFGGPPAAPSFGGPPSGSLGAATGSLGSAPTPGTGGGWLGDGGGGSSAYSPPSSRGGGWLGDGDAGPAPPPISMPSMAPPELGSGHDSPALSLPDHTVAVDLGTPWEDEAQAAQSNKMVYVVLACLVLSLTGFFGFIWWQKRKLVEPTRVVDPGEKADALTPGLQNLKEARALYQSKRWEEAQGKAETAYLLVGTLKIASKEQRAAVTEFYRQATTRYGQALSDEANRHFKNRRTSQALNSCEAAVLMYAKVSGTNKEQARVRALEGKICESIGDSAGAVSAYRKAHDLYPAGGYKALANQVRADARRQVQAPPDSAPPPEAPEIQGSLGDEQTYQTRQPGHYTPRGTTAAPPQAVPQGSAPKPRPVVNYVPKKVDTTPSWRKRGSDVLPTYDRKH